MMIYFNTARRQDELIDLRTRRPSTSHAACGFSAPIYFAPTPMGAVRLGQRNVEADADDVMQADAAQDEAEGIAEAEVYVTYFFTPGANRLTTETLSLAGLRERVLNVSAREKAKLPWLKLAKFGTKRTDKNSLRHDGNVLEITGIELDYDIEQISFDNAVKAVEAMGIHALLYTSASHTPDKPRWRVLAPTSRPCAPELRYRLVARLNGFLKATLKVEVIAKSESFALSQSFYYGWVCDSPKPDHRAEVVYGSFIDQRDDLAAFEAGGGPPTKDGDRTTGSGSTGTTGTGTTGNTSIDWAAVEQHSGWLKGVADLDADFSRKGKAIIAHSGNLKDLNFDLQHAKVLAKPYQSWSEVAFALTAIFKHNGRYSNEQIAAALLADLDCNQHITKINDQAKQHRTIERLILRSHEPPPGKVRKAGAPDWRERKENGAPVPSMHNARLAIVALGIECSHDTFHNKVLFGFKDDSVRHAVEHIVGEVTDNGIIALRQLMSDTFGFDLTDKHTRDAVTSLGLDRRFDPVVDMLAEAEAGWDGAKRLDRMAAEYFNCEDTPLNRACIRKTMIAAVARVRCPGIKKDEILVLESEEGYNKSTAWRVLAGDENFSDESIIGANSREVQEQLAEVWIHENADLAGMKKTEVETVKAYASRQTDRARPAYGHFLKKQKRHSIEVGTTNSDRYLQSQTGNRRFWPLRVLKSIDIAKLKRDRLQLWGEAAHYQSQGESLVLDEKLWGEAAVEQEARRVPDPWEDVLRNMPDLTTYGYWKDGSHHEGTRTITYYDEHEEKVIGSHVLEYVLGIQPGNQTTQHTMRLSTVMKQLGWERAKNGYVSIDSLGRVKGYSRKRGAE
jgi:predicted P-loop ATPase